MDKRKIISFGIVILLITLFFIGKFYFLKFKERGIVNVDSCIKAGYPLIQTTPTIKECRTPSGKKFELHISSQISYPIVEDIGGFIMYISLNPQIITIRDNSGKEINVTIKENTKFYNEQDKFTDFNFLKKGMWITARGERLDESLFAPWWIKFIK